MATFTWYLQGGTPTTIGATDLVKFAGASFTDPVVVSSYNDSTHVASSGGANSSSGNTPKNNKFVDSTHVDLGAGSVLLSSLANSDCALKINFSHGSSVVTTGAVFYAYDGTTTTAVPTNVTIKAVEKGGSTWGTPAGSGASIALADQATNTSHDFYIAVSASPTDVGNQTAFAFRIELTYS